MPAPCGRLPDAVLLDAYVPGQAGGTGQTIDAKLLAALPPLPPVILAGGLTPENVAARIALVRPWMVDVASGVESAPGCKDPARVDAFLRAVRGDPIDRIERRDPQYESAETTSLQAPAADGLLEHQDD